MIATEEGLLMKLFVIGATGRTGLEIVHQALARGHHVTAFVRSPESITLRNDRLTVLKGNVMDENQLFNAMQSHDAVLSALGQRKVFKPSSLLRDSAVATLSLSWPLPPTPFPPHSISSAISRF
jgi:putative NADH-flavin reductase